MIPIQPFFDFPIKVYNKLSAQIRENDNLLKKIMKTTYNALVPPLITTLATVACVAGVIFACIGNVFTFPFAIYSQSRHISTDDVERTLPIALSSHTAPNKKAGFFSKLLKKEEPDIDHYPKLKYFEGPLPADYAERESFVHLDFSNVEGLPPSVEDENFPCTFSRRSTQQKAPPPKIATTWPPRGENGTNSLSVEFLQEKTTIPETHTTFWGLMQQAGTLEGYKYLDEKLQNILPLIFPTRISSRLNPQAPTLSREMVSLVQTNPEMTSKYFLSLSMVLQYWGLQISPTDKSITLASDFEARAAAIKENPYKEEMFQQVLTSLGECGFGSLCIYLAIVLNEHHADYGISSTTPFYNALKGVKTLETMIEQKTKETIKKSQERHPPDTQVEEIRWDTYLNLLPSTGEANNREQGQQREDKPFAWTRLSSLLGFLFSLDDGLKNQMHRELGECSFLDPIIKTSIDPDDARPVLDKLKAPHYFFSLEKEKELTQPPPSPTS